MLLRFVRSVSTIIFTITNERFVNALVGIVTLEIILLTILFSARTGFIGSVFTILGRVAIPVLRNADSGCLALELLIGALVGSDGRTAEFVGSVVAVRNSVAFVGLVDALVLVAAFELGGGAGDRRTVLFVCVVEAVWKFKIITYS